MEEMQSDGSNDHSLTQCVDLGKASSTGSNVSSVEFSQIRSSLQRIEKKIESRDSAVLEEVRSFINRFEQKMKQTSWDFNTDRACEFRDEMFSYLSDISARLGGMSISDRDKVDPPDPSLSISDRDKVEMVMKSSRVMKHMLMDCFSGRDCRDPSVSIQEQIFRLSRLDDEMDDIKHLIEQYSQRLHEQDGGTVMLDRFNPSFNPNMTSGSVETGTSSTAG
jgi:hypothetical protein